MIFLLLACSAPPTHSGGGKPERAGEDSTAPALDSGDGSPTTEEPESRPEAWSVGALGLGVASGSMRATAVAWDAKSGGFVAIWGTVPTTFHIEAALLEDGVAGPVLAVDDGPFDAFEPDIASDGAGTLLAVYEDDRDGGGTCCREIYGQLFSTTSGSLEGVGPDFNITKNQPIEQWTPAVAWESGSFFVAYSDDRDYTGADERRLYGRPVGPDGTVGTEVKLGGDSLWQTVATVTGSDGAGRLLVVWGDYDPVGGGLDAGYRARVIEADGSAVSEVLTLVRYGDQTYDRPSIAWNPWRQAWLIVWMQPYALYSSTVSLEGELLETGVPVLSPEDGAGAARLAWSPTTNSYLLAYHSWWTTEAWVQPLDTNGRAVGERMPVSETTPPLGTFYQPIAIAADRAQATVVPSLDWGRVEASLYVAE